MKIVGVSLARSSRCLTASRTSQGRGFLFRDPGLSLSHSLAAALALPLRVIDNKKQQEEDEREFFPSPSTASCLRVLWHWRSLRGSLVSEQSRCTRLYGASDHMRRERGMGNGKMRTGIFPCSVPTATAVVRFVPMPYPTPDDDRVPGSRIVSMHISFSPPLVYSLTRYRSHSVPSLSDLLPLPTTLTLAHVPFMHA